MKKGFLFFFVFMFSGSLFADAQDNEAKALLQAFLKPGADHAGLTKKLFPTAKDCKAFFIDSVSEKAWSAYQTMWQDKKAVIRPKANQTELILFSVTIDEIKKGIGFAKDFPGGYKNIVDKIKPGIKIYRFKFVAPGEKSGMAFDGLVKVNQKWVIFPKPWKALE